MQDQHAPSPLRALADDATYLAYRSASLTARLLPMLALEGLATSIAAALDLAGGRRRRMVARHQTRLAGRELEGFEERRRVQAVFASYGRYWAEAFRLPDLTEAELSAGMRTEGLEHLDEGLAGGRGVILALPHLGGWEWAGAWAVTTGRPVTVVVEPLSPPDLFEWFVELRKGLGMQVVPLGEGAATEVLAALRRNEIVCLLCDRDIGGGGVSVEFFGEVTTLPAGPVTLALRSGAPLLPSAIYFAGRGGHLGVMRPPLELTRRGRLRDDVARLTQELASELEVLIGREPEQWHLVQPNWPSDWEHW